MFFVQIQVTTELMLMISTVFLIGRDGRDAGLMGKTTFTISLLG